MSQTLAEKVGGLAMEVRKIQDHPFYPRFGKQQKKAACREFSGILRMLVACRSVLHRDRITEKLLIDTWKRVLKEAP